MAIKFIYFLFFMKKRSKKKMKEMDIVNKEEMCMNMLRTDTWEGIKIKCW